MFVQIIQGRVRDRAGVDRLMDRWLTERSAEAEGWLGSTYGVSDDGELVATARFADADAARANSDRPEQHAWWLEFEKLFDEAPTVHDCSRAEPLLGGGSDDAGFVQLMQSSVTDAEALEAGLATFRPFDSAAPWRPDLIGLLVCWHDAGDGLSVLAHFTSEEEARASEARFAADDADPPAEIAEAMQRWNDAVADTRYVDLRQPRLASPA